jgi:hypothetical protein
MGLLYGISSDQNPCLAVLLDTCSAYSRIGDTAIASNGYKEGFLKVERDDPFDDWAEDFEYGCFEWAFGLDPDNSLATELHLLVIEQSSGSQ